MLLERDQKQSMAMYDKWVGDTSIKSIIKLGIEEIKDRFGPPPEAVSNLLRVMEVRLMMKRKGLIRLDVKEDKQKKQRFFNSFHNAPELMIDL